MATAIETHREETPPGFETHPEGLVAAFRAVRRATHELAEPLQPEDCVVQSMPDASPTKWHLAHTSWFFETFLLRAISPTYQSASPEADYLFNSYYNAVGERIPRHHRGLMTRPSLDEIHRYRAEVDRRVLDWLADAPSEQLRKYEPIVVIGLNHEQQHQELLLTDVKHLFGANPLHPVYREIPGLGGEAPGPISWMPGRSGVQEIGFDGEGFSFDNERPRHREYLEPHEVASRLSTVGEYLAFMDDGGYRRPEFWLSDGWAARSSESWQAPLYWERVDGAWWNYRLAGFQPVEEAEPVVHLSYYEADAFARWSKARLPTEAEWETMASGLEISGNFLESGRFHPIAAGPSASGSPSQMFGDAWEWTSSPYTAYPGFRTAEGALGEYNGKFMCNQMILRGGSCASPRSHLRTTYRNFFGPKSRWQFSGVRLAR